ICVLAGHREFSRRGRMAQVRRRRPGNVGKHHHGRNIMKRLGMLAATTLSLLFLGLTLPAGDAVAQQKSLKEQLVGTWTPVSTKYKFPDGKTTDTMGPDLRGLIMFDANG